MPGAFCGSDCGDYRAVYQQEVYLLHRGGDRGFSVFWNLVFAVFRGLCAVFPDDLCAVSVECGERGLTEYIRWREGDVQYSLGIGRLLGFLQLYFGGDFFIGISLGFWHFFNVGLLQLYDMDNSLNFRTKC